MFTIDSIVEYGKRHDLALAVAGGLVRANWIREQAIKFIVCAAEGGWR